MNDWCNSDLRSVSPIVIECVEIVQRSAYIFHPNDDKNIDSLGLGVLCIVSNVTFSNNSVKSWRSVLLLEETEVPGEIH
jgi:hypothetical protein